MLAALKPNPGRMDGEQEYLLARRAAANPEWDARLRAMAAVRQGRPLMPPAGAGSPTMQSILNALPVENPRPMRPMPAWIGVRG